MQPINRTCVSVIFASMFFVSFHGIADCYTTHNFVTNLESTDIYPKPPNLVDAELPGVCEPLCTIVTLSHGNGYTCYERCTDQPKLMKQVMCQSQQGN